MSLICFILLSALVSHLTSAIISKVVVVNGTEAKPHSRPYMVSLQNTSGQHFCGGFLVSKDFVLTAANCYDSVKNMVAVLGAHDLNATDNERIKVKEYIVHPNYSSGECWPNDIMLLKLESPVNLSETIKWIPMSKQEPLKNTVCSTAGWGLTTDNGQPSNRLLEVNSIITSKDTCRDQMQQCAREEGTLCAGGLNYGFCQGDGGGPLVCNKEAVGISSFILSSCESKRPNVYTKIYDFLPWIKSKMHDCSVLSTCLLPKC